MPDFPRKDLIKLTVTAFCSRCSKDAPCDDCIFTGVGLAENIPATSANIAAAYRYLRKLEEEGKLTADESRAEDARLQSLPSPE